MVTTKNSSSSFGAKTTIQNLTDVPESAWDEIRERWPHVRKGEVPDKFGNVTVSKPLSREKWHEGFVAICSRHVHERPAVSVV